MALSGYEWVSNSKNGGGAYVGEAGGVTYQPSILIHMTVSHGISASYISTHPYPPHLWANPYDGRLYQTVELDRAAYALYQPQYTTHWTNRKAYCLQTEVIGVPEVSTATWTDDQVRWIAHNVVVPQERWLRERGMTANIGNYRYHANTSGSASEYWPGRMSDAEWGAFHGLCAHIDVVGNDHWDASAERLDHLSQYALEELGGAIPGAGDMPLNEADFARITQIVHDQMVTIWRETEMHYTDVARAQQGAHQSGIGLMRSEEFADIIEGAVTTAVNETVTRMKANQAEAKPSGS